jgi:acetamidase/formamidase
VAIHRLTPETATTHGAFNPELEPILTIDPGDTIHYRTLVAGWWEEPGADDIVERTRLRPREGVEAGGHCLVGPVAIRGAEPGMTLVVRINRIDPGVWGETFSGGRSSHVNDWFQLTGETDRLAARWTMEWNAETRSGVGRVNFGYEVPLRPFFGVIGMPPAEPGWHPTSPPRLTGGNIDCKELVAGSTLYLPIQVSGGLVSLGDGHGTQTDGEVSGMAIECPIDYAEIAFDLLPDQPLSSPWAETDAGTITFGFDKDLDKASLKALQAMTTLLGHRYGMTTQQALVMASVVVDLRVTQIVNGVQGVHAVLPNDAIKRISG